MTDQDPRDRLEEERAQPISEHPGPVEIAPRDRPMHNDQDLARRLSFVLNRDGLNLGPDSVILSERHTAPDEPRRFVVSIKDHDHGGEYHLTPHLTPAGLSAWINGLETGLRNEPTEMSNDE